ncbi:MAG: O-antigen ligase family protein [Candidatus Brocadiae bacterium]|nr:O-antigen ligase family protein [Candidatus Brocadiia bacterium]
MTNIYVASIVRLVFTYFLWIMIWANINTGIWMLENPQRWIEWFHAVRCFFPYIALIIVMLFYSKNARFKKSGPIQMWIVYGIICCLSSMASLEPLHALYWAGLYICTLVVLRSMLLNGDDPLERSANLMEITWWITLGYIAVIVFITRDAIMSGVLSESAYSHFSGSQEIIGVGISRSSGIARFAAVISLLALVRTFYCIKVAKTFYIFIFVFCIFLVYKMQSRGAILGLIGGILFLIMIQKFHSRFIIMTLIALVLTTFAFDPQNAFEEKALEYLRRGQDNEELATMTGRTGSYARGWDLFQESPIIGLGGLADRIHLDWEHIHNTYLHTLVQGGILGTIFFILGLIMGWRSLFFLLKYREFLSVQHRKFLIEAGVILVFFTIRSIPECSGSSFGVDLLIMLASLAYLQILQEQFLFRNQN